MAEPTDHILAENGVGQTTLPEFDGSEKTAEVALRNGVRLLSDVEKAWLGGVIDGEGSIFISKVAYDDRRRNRGFHYVPILSVSNSNKTFIYRVRDTIGKGSVALDKEKNPRWKDKWQYNGSSGVLRGLLPQILPNLMIKHEVAERMLEYLAFVDSCPIDGFMEIPSGYYERLDTLYSAVKQLNEKGERTFPNQLENLLSQPGNPNRRGPGSRTKNCRRMSDSERAWLAGVIDGEGSIFLSKVSGANYRRGFFYRPQMAVSNTSRSFLIRVGEVVGEGTVQLAQRGNGNWKTRWMYCAVAGVLRVVLPQIIPHMIIKRAQAEKMLEFLAFVDQNSILGSREVPPRYYEGLDKFYWTIRKLNEKGRMESSHHAQRIVR